MKDNVALMWNPRSHFNSRPVSIRSAMCWMHVSRLMLDSLFRRLPEYVMRIRVVNNDVIGIKRISKGTDMGYNTCLVEECCYIGYYSSLVVGYCYFLLLALWSSKPLHCKVCVHASFCVDSCLRLSHLGIASVDQYFALQSARLIVWWCAANIQLRTRLPLRIEDASNKDELQKQEFVLTRFHTMEPCGHRSP